MAINEKDVRHVARLARLKLEGEEVRRYQEQLGRILEHMQELKELDTESVEPTAHVLGLVNVLRADEPKPFPGRQAILGNAPEADGPYFKVPKVIE